MTRNFKRESQTGDSATTFLSVSKLQISTVTCGKDLPLPFPGDMSLRHRTLLRWTVAKDTCAKPLKPLKPQWRKGGADTHWRDVAAVVLSTAMVTKQLFENVAARKRCRGQRGGQRQRRRRAVCGQSSEPGPTTWMAKTHAACAGPDVSASRKTQRVELLGARQRATSQGRCERKSRIVGTTGSCLRQTWRSTAGWCNSSTRNTFMERSRPISALMCPCPTFQCCTTPAHPSSPQGTVWMAQAVPISHTSALGLARVGAPSRAA